MLGRNIFWDATQIPIRQLIQIEKKLGLFESFRQQFGRYHFVRALVLCIVKVYFNHATFSKVSKHFLQCLFLAFSQFSLQ